MGGKCELLAPAGGMRQLRAAVENGADAVYLGGKLFNARVGADNFSDEEIRNAIEYAHIRNVKIYVTMNTLLQDDELWPALEYAKFLYETGVDALILQDLGLTRLIRQTMPQCRIHLSTQGTVYNLSGVRAAKNLGFERVVLARELSLEEIEEITSANIADIEIFVHGALCICYSGQCQMSRMIGGRSGNRGICAQPCRLPYTLATENAVVNGQEVSGAYQLSPKDLCMIDHLNKLVRAGVTSFKIEGRMKSAEYVAIVTGIYRKYLDLCLSESAYTVSEEDREMLAQIFNRGGFTEGYLFGNQGEALMSSEIPKHQGVRIGTVVNIPKEQNLIDVELTKPLLMGDGIEIHNQTMPGNVVTFLKPLTGDVVRVGDIKGVVHVKDPVFKITDSQLLAEARDTFEDRGGALRYSKRILIDMEFFAEIGKPSKLILKEVGGISETEITDPVLIAEAAIKKPITAELIEKQLRKTGDVPFDIRTVKINLESELSMPLSAINALRRNGFAALMQEKIRVRRNPVQLKESVIKKVASPLPLGNPRFPSATASQSKHPPRAAEGGPSAHPFLSNRKRYFLLDKKPDTTEQDSITELYFYVGDDALTCPVDQLQAKFNQNQITFGKLRLYLPLYDYMEKSDLMEKIALKYIGAQIIPYIFNVSKGSLDQYIAANMDKIVDRCKADGISIGNLGLLQEFLNAGVPVYGDYGLNVYNEASKRALRGMGVEAVTASLEASNNHIGPIPLMVSEHKINASSITDRKGAVYSIINHEIAEKTMILSHFDQIDYAALKQRRSNGESVLRIYFTNETEK